MGFSERRRSSAVCRIRWDARNITWTIQRFRAVPDEQIAAIQSIAGRELLLAAAFDGPLRQNLDLINRYRVAERMLTRRFQLRIGKPGQSNAPVGIKLNAAANTCAGIVRDQCEIALTQHPTKIDEKALVEAFPTAFLGMMLLDPSVISSKRGDRSDKYYEALVSDATLINLIEYLLPNRMPTQDLKSVTNHDDRAALVCALTALCVASGTFTAVGDCDGWIILPPRRFIRGWAWVLLETNASEEKPGCLVQIARPVRSAA